MTAGQTCPVEHIDTPCPPRPVSATIKLLNIEGRTIATTTSAVDGRYVLWAPAGRWTIIVETDIFPRCPPTAATRHIASTHDRRRRLRFLYFIAVATV